MHIMTFLNEVGTFIGGMGLLAGGGAAWVALYSHQRRSMRLSWYDSYQQLVGEFWRDKEMAEVRKWISSDPLYQANEEVFVKRTKSTNNALDQPDNDVIESFDRFCSFLARLRFFTRESQRQKLNLPDLGGSGEYWIDQIKKREALRQYIVKPHIWPELAHDL